MINSCGFVIVVVVVIAVLTFKTKRIRKCKDEATCCIEGCIGFDVSCVTSFELNQSSLSVFPNLFQSEEPSEVEKFPWNLKKSLENGEHCFGIVFRV